VSQSQGGRVREARRDKSAPEAIVHSGSHRWEADHKDACRQRHVYADVSSIVRRCVIYSVQKYIPSILHQFLIQWIDDKIEVVHADVSSYIALADVTADWQHGSARCLSGRDLTGYVFLSVSKKGFVPMSVKPAFEAQLGNVVFQ
jgi:hypothetical protein